MGRQKVSIVCLHVLILFEVSGGGERKKEFAFLIKNKKCGEWAHLVKAFNHFDNMSCISLVLCPLPIQIQKLSFPVMMM